MGRLDRRSGSKFFINRMLGLTSWSSWLVWFNAFVFFHDKILKLTKSENS